ncbi:hypothetical protein QOT17_001733 [Balamuthia mandrillaris]
MAGSLTVALRSCRSIRYLPSFHSTTKNHCFSLLLQHTIVLTQTMLKLLSPKRRKSYGDTLPKRERIKDEFAIVRDSLADAAEETSSHRRSQKRKSLNLLPLTPPHLDTDKPDSVTATEASSKALTPPKSSTAKRRHKKGRRSAVRFLDLPFPEAENGAREELDVTSPVAARHSPPPLSARPEKGILRSPPKNHSKKKRKAPFPTGRKSATTITLDAHQVMAILESNRKLEQRVQGLEATVKAIEEGDALEDAEQ